jgi:hypothetical protein
MLASSACDALRRANRSHEGEGSYAAQIRENQETTRTAVTAQPRLMPDGVYEATPRELVASMSQNTGALRWVGASVRISGRLVHLGSPEEARVRRLNDGKPFAVLAEADADVGARPGSFPVAVCELDGPVFPGVAEGQLVRAEGEVLGAAGPGAADVHCTSLTNR